MHINTIGGSHSKASADFTNITSNSTDYVFNQHSTIELNGTDKQTWYVDNIPNTSAEQIETLNEKGDVRRSKDLKVYIPGHDNETYANALNTDGSTVSNIEQEPLENVITQAGNILAGSLPGQIFRLRGMGNEEIFTREIGLKKYEIKDHLQSSIITVKDVKKPIDVGNDGVFESAEAQVVSYQETYPFGMQMPGRGYSPTSYRFDFNGKPTDHELIDWQDYGERMYMKRICRFPTPDPLIVKGQQYPELSPYQFAGNTPIWAIDLDGLEPTPYEAVLIAKHVYGVGKLKLLKGKDAVKLVGGWEYIRGTVDRESGFKSGLYRRLLDENKYEYVYATAGTELNNLKDMDANYDQLSGTSIQYRESVNMALKYNRMFENSILTFVGHSLGGGLASANSLVTGREAFTFNAAGLSDDTKMNLGNIKPAKINAFVLQGELVSFLQSSIGLKAEGNIIKLNASYSFDSGISMTQRLKNHFIDKMAKELMNQGYGNYKLDIDYSKFKYSKPDFIKAESDNIK